MKVTGSVINFWLYAVYIRCMFGSPQTRNQKPQYKRMNTPLDWIAVSKKRLKKWPVQSLSDWEVSSHLAAPILPLSMRERIRYTRIRTHPIPGFPATLLPCYPVTLLPSALSPKLNCYYRQCFISNQFYCFNCSTDRDTTDDTIRLCVLCHNRIKTTTVRHP